MGHKNYDYEGTNVKLYGCECCLGNESLYWKDNENNAFVDSKGEVLTTVKDRIMRYKVKYCPNCGREFQGLKSDFIERMCYI